jgi:LmbE family N-acetylglucosaminyl deacetylase
MAERRLTAVQPPASGLVGRVVALSTHLDDVILSLGAGLTAAARRGADLRIVTVLSGDPSQRCAADASNRFAGFGTAGEAARVRQAEDAKACARIGARPSWLGFSDDANDPRPDDAAIEPAVRDAVAGADAVLLGGWPLSHADHAWLTALALRVVADGALIGFFVEQPYAAWRVLSREHGIDVRGLVAKPAVAPPIPPDAVWRRVRARSRDWRAKLQAVREYRSQRLVLRRAVTLRIAAHELLHGGELLTWCTVSAEARASRDEEGRA